MYTIRCLTRGRRRRRRRLALWRGRRRSRCGGADGLRRTRRRRGRRSAQCTVSAADATRRRRHVEPAQVSERVKGCRACEEWLCITDETSRPPVLRPFCVCLASPCPVRAMSSPLVQDAVRVVQVVRSQPEVMPLMVTALCFLPRPSLSRNSPHFSLACLSYNIERPGPFAGKTLFILSEIRAL